LNFTGHLLRAHPEQTDEEVGGRKGRLFVFT
jgi:hypothetical protein